VSIPSPDDAIAFVVFFFPGFITLLLLSHLCGISLKQRSDLEKIVLSSIFSILSFLVVGVSLQTENIAMAIFNIGTILRVFSASVALAIVIWISIKAWDFFIDVASARLQRLWAKLGRTYRSTETSSSYVLRQLYDAKEKNEVVIHTSSGEIYKGSFQGYTPNPLEILLVRTKETPIRQLKKDRWEEVDEYLMYFNEKDIRRISAIKAF